MCAMNTIDAPTNAPRPDAHTRLCAVIGNPVAHSLSPAMHNAAFRETGLNYIYLAFKVTHLEGCMAGLRALDGFRGLSVTIPHKMDILQYLDEVTPLARSVGCVNTVVNAEGRLLGTITDGTGTLRAFEHAGVSLKDKTILFAGTGGAARAVAFALADSRLPREILVLGRTPSRVARLVEDLRHGSRVRVHGGDLGNTDPDKARACDVIINATPMGMFRHSEGESSVPRDWLHAGQVVFDMVYRPRRTRLLLDAEESGCRIIPGLEMLLFQAVLQFELWTGQRAPDAVMRNALQKALESDV
ncbi:MAG: Shikimate dehydrogenase [Candidatus Hydrogenedentes bacterium ADurb.Bin101]|nr:MAG: Shikimate dehydrogenase [Candidatus Hydrogenedentes bacterium ADurb.Bin101]